MLKRVIVGPCTTHIQKGDIAFVADERREGQGVFNPRRRSTDDRRKPGNQKSYTSSQDPRVRLLERRKSVLNSAATAAAYGDFAKKRT